MRLTYRSDKVVASVVSKNLLIPRLLLKGVKTVYDCAPPSGTFNLRN